MNSLMQRKSSIAVLLHPYFLLNLLASLAYIATKHIPIICQKMYGIEDNCQFDWRDQEILIFMCFVIVVKNRRWKPTLWTEYVSNVFMFTKCANFLLFMRKDLRFGFLYTIVCLGLFLLAPEPKYKGPENITYFRGQALEEELLLNPKTVYVIEFFASWSSPCNYFSSVFADISLRYNDEFLKFGKLDVGRYPVVAKKFNVNSSVTSKQLPTIILFVDGKEKIRRPIIDSKSTVWKYIFTKENIIRDFNLNEHLEDSRKKKTKFSKGSNGETSTQTHKAKKD